MLYPVGGPFAVIRFSAGDQEGIQAHGFES